MRRVAVSLTTIGALTCAPMARAADTPRQAYDHYVGCTADMVALQAALGRDGAKGAAESAKLDPQVKMMRDKAVAAGAAVSAPADRVSLRIDQERDHLLKTLDEPDAAKARAARGDVGRATLVCVFDELGKAIAARKAAQASASR